MLGIRSGFNIEMVYIKRRAPGSSALGLLRYISFKGIDPDPSPRTFSIVSVASVIVARM